MNRYLLLIIILLSNLCSFGQNNGDGAKKVLILTSYSADSRRVVDFINDFEQLNKYDFTFILENMNFRGLNESKDWREMMINTLDRYRDTKIEGVILLGQEAWGTYLGIEDIIDAPFYGCYISENGIIVPEEEFDYKTWDPVSVNTVEYAKKRGGAGGIVNIYDVEANIKLIISIYPSVNNIAFISDNSYGGLSLQTHVKDVMKRKFPNIELTILDGRRECNMDIKHKIAKLDDKSAVLIGTWRLNNDGVFVIQSSINDLFELRHNKIPVFTLTGNGLDQAAIGGYFPDYNMSIELIVRNLKERESKNFTKTQFNFTKNKYVFNKTKIEEYGIQSFQLPKGSIINDESTLLLKKYQSYIVFVVLFSLMLFTALIISLYFYRKNIKVNKILKEQQEILEKQKEELHVAKEIAENSDKLKSAFLANMSHEIRTPLNAIVGFSELIKDAESVEEREEYWSIISNNSDLLLRLIGDILDLSKIESGILELHIVEFDMATVYNDTYLTLKQRVTNPEVELKLVNPYSSCVVKLDQSRLTQIITNFVTNAIKFTPNGFIEMGYECVDNGIKIYCRDSGIGISEDKINKVFDRFLKLDNFAQGTGLGMAICKAIVDAKGGRIGVESEEGKGSFFWAWMPCEVRLM